MLELPAINVARRRIGRSAGSGNNRNSSEPSNMLEVTSLPPESLDSKLEGVLR